MFTATLFTTAKIRKQPKCPLTDKQKKKMRYIHTVEYYSVTKKDEYHLQQHGRPQNYRTKQSKSGFPGGSDSK